jgi:Leucine rich repeat
MVPLTGRKLQGIYVSRNRLTGTIPSTLCNQTSLHDMFLDSNGLRGTIPTCFNQLTQLKQLYLFRNQFSGSLPSTISQLRQLSTFTWRYLWCLSHSLTHCVHSICFVTNHLLLGGLGIESNNISGDITNDLCIAFNNNAKTASPLKDFWSDCGGSNPNITCSCCTVCCPGDQCS